MPISHDAPRHEYRTTVASELRLLEPRGEQPLRIAGYAAIFGQLSEAMGGFREIIQPGAFTAVLSRSPDVRGLWNHDTARVLGRTVARTLALEEDDRGLWYELVPPETPDGQAIAELIRRGDVSGSSFAFRVALAGEIWSEDDEGPIRTITEVRELFDVGPVTYPAYPDTTVAVRSLEQWQAREERRRSRDQTTRTDELWLLEHTQP